eukprot:NODE_2453_length_1061_cov_9.971092_g2435_i0.p1 GENE.NODE_2453_length_1061_cov_9.971092_g2435_i0~~NODE_2453_length_1061_cov_9.971092_g2435_i0.p1  ORF type:complete len:248 (+),score=20.84 NODE_2453_length_1061_cov_9.971092_g2435_i0:102-845(+)
MCILIAVAVQQEAVHLEKLMQTVERRKVLQFDMLVGAIGSHIVHVLLTDIGMVNAACALTAYLVSHSAPSVILNFGCAGAHTEAVQPGDLVVAQYVAPLSSMRVLPDGQLKVSGFRRRVDEAKPKTLPCDAGWADRLAAATESIGPRHIGTIGASDTWTQQPDQLRALHAAHGSLCEDMESAAIAQVAARFGVPFAAVRDVSNNELQGNATCPEASGSAKFADREGIGRLSAQVIHAALLAHTPTAT